MKIGAREIGTGNPCAIVCEIGINHNGSVETAKKMIDVAVEVGADFVKFQKRTISAVYTQDELARPRESPWGTTNGDQKRGLELSWEAYAEIDAHCEDVGITWFASPWDTASVTFLEQFDVPAYKVASACLTDTALLHAIRRTGKPVICSTGMSTIKEIGDAYDLFAWSGTPPALLVCTSTYPADLSDLHLARIWTMQTAYPAAVIGYSGHEVGIWTTVCAAAMGASIIERHLTLDRAMYGSDQAASLEPKAFAKMVQEIRDWETARGDGAIRLLPAEMAVREKLRRVK